MNRVLEWDSSFFGMPIGESHVATGGELRAADDWGRGEKLRCQYLMIPSDCFPLIASAESKGFRLSGVRMSLAAEAPFRPDLTGTGEMRVRAVRDSDIVPLERIAATAHPDTRFFADANFPREACERLYETWIRRSAEGWADCVLVADSDAGGPVGYVTLHKAGDQTARIGLIAVASDTRRSGIGRALMVDAFRWCDRNNVRRVSVATQAQNTSALRFYLRCGFNIDQVDFWLHKWW